MALLSVREVAQIMGVNRKTVRRQIQTKNLRGRRFGRQYRVSPESVIEAMGLPADTDLRKYLND